MKPCDSVPIFKAFRVYFIAFEQFKPTQLYSTSYLIYIRVLPFNHSGFCLDDTIDSRIPKVCIKSLSLPLTVCQVLDHCLNR